MKHIYFSVVIPMYNALHTIYDTIGSIISQTYVGAVEIIVVNDGSTDGCERIVQDIIAYNLLKCNNRFITLINVNNGGVSKARNIAIKEAKGEFIAFLDSDDRWHPQKLDILKDVLNNNSITFLGHSYVLETNFNKRFDNIYPIRQVSFLQLLLKNFAVTPSIVIKKDVCEYFDESMSYTEDHELWLRIALHERVFYIDLPLTVIGRPQLSQGGLSANKWAMRKGELQMYLNIIRIKKILIPVLPLLILFSLFKHFRKYLYSLFT